MTMAEIAVALGGVGAIAFLSWFFFGPRQAKAAQVKGNVQEIEVTVKVNQQNGLSSTLLPSMESKY